MTSTDSEDKPISETVTVSFIANVEVDPEEFDLRVKNPAKSGGNCSGRQCPGAVYNGCVGTRRRDLNVIDVESRRREIHE
jgi:hypothetical protein